MSEKKKNPLKEMLMAYDRKLAQLSPEEQAKKAAEREAWAKKYLRLVNDNLDDLEMPPPKK